MVTARGGPHALEHQRLALVPYISGWILQRFVRSPIEVSPHH